MSSSPSPNPRIWISEKRIVIPESTDYSVLFYILDGCFFVVCVLSFWLTITIRKSALTTTQSLRKIWNKASLILFSLLFTWGAVMGVKDTYLVPYLSDDLGASSQLLSEENDHPKKLLHLLPHWKNSTDTFSVDFTGI